MKMLICLIVAVIAAVAVVFGFWLHGFNFDERGSMAIGCYVTALFSAAMIGLLAAVVVNDPPR